MEQTSIADRISDRISNIPEHLMENILARLPLREAIKTSVLSTKWRRIWEILPLVFDDNFANSLEDRRRTKKEILLIIYQVLLLHRWPVVKFCLSISGLESCPEIDHMLQYLSRNDIQELTLSFSKGGPHKLPSSFFSSEELRRMNISGCSFKLPVAFNGFKKLIFASFNKVSFDDGTLQNLISKSPSLQRLELFRCEHVDHINLFAPKLRSLIIHTPMSICFKDTPLLTYLFIFTWKGVKPGAKDMVEALGCLPSLYFLCASHDFLTFLAAGNIAERLPSCFNRLRNLKIVLLCLHKLEVVSSSLSLIRISRLLRELMIHVVRMRAGEDFNDVVEFLQVEKHSKIRQNKLEEVVINNFAGTRVEMELVQLLLYTSPLLKRMRIYPDNSCIHNNEHIRILKDIAGYPRASPQARIVYFN